MLVIVATTMKCGRSIFLSPSRLTAIEKHLRMNVYTLSMDVAEERRGQ
jgi:hypothetical protein